MQVGGAEGDGVVVSCGEGRKGLSVEVTFELRPGRGK